MSVSVGTAVAGKDVAVLVGEATAVSVAGIWVAVGTAVFATTATRVGTAVLSAVETAVAVSPSTLHPASSRQNSKMKEKVIGFMATSRGEL
ncbi:MAG: hypothetical protein HND44_11365 [Chloroflexi bacterium]|nr:hypothetical protein [Ardenticatenaceae bacterium]NOG35156.1 hypothetical protein [Chloroflexota bacterium]